MSTLELSIVILAGLLGATGKDWRDRFFRMVVACLLMNISYHAVEAHRHIHVVEEALTGEVSDNED